METPVRTICINADIMKTFTGPARPSTMMTGQQAGNAFVRQEKIQSSGYLQLDTDRLHVPVLSGTRKYTKINN